MTRRTDVPLGVRWAQLASLIHRGFGMPVEPDVKSAVSGTPPSEQRPDDDDDDDSELAGGGAIRTSANDEKLAARPTGEAPPARSTSPSRSIIWSAG